MSLEAQEMVVNRLSLGKETGKDVDAIGPFKSTY